MIYNGNIGRSPNYEREANFFYMCWRCGALVPFMVDMPYNRVFCEGCKEPHETEKQERLKEYLQLKTHVMHERALRILEKQHVKMYKYKDGAEVVLEAALKEPEKFASSHEMVAAMELIRHQIKVKTQQKIGRYRLDFLLPELKAVLEVDGYMHRHHKSKDSKRDIDVLSELGPGWEIVRIPTKYIEQNIKALVTAIKEIKRYKQEARSKNNGMLPLWYSEREQAYYKELQSK